MKFHKPSLDMAQNSMLCAPQGFFFFLLAGVTAIDSVILDDKKRKEEALYSMKKNVLPFLEVILIMLPIMVFMHKKANLPTSIVNIITPLICITIAFSICMLLRISGLRDDCCNDINYKKESIFNENGVFQNFSFNLKKNSKESCCNRNPNIYVNVGERRNSIHLFLYKIIFTIILFPLLIIQILDLNIRKLINFSFYSELKEKDKEKIKELEDTKIPFSIFSILSAVPFCEKYSGNKINKLCE